MTALLKSLQGIIIPSISLKFVINIRSQLYKLPHSQPMSTKNGYMPFGRLSEMILCTYVCMNARVGTYVQWYQDMLTREEDALPEVYMVLLD